MFEVWMGFALKHQADGSLIYKSPFGDFKIPAAVRLTAQRLRLRRDRWTVMVKYLDRWCRQQWRATPAIA